MKNFKKIATAATLMAMATSTQGIQAQEYVSQLGGCGYQESYACQSTAPYIILGTVAVIAIIVLAVSNSHHRHSHAH